MTKFSMSVRVLVSALGASTVLVGTTAEAFAASGVSKHANTDRHQENADAEHDDLKSAIAQVRVRTENPDLPSQVEVGPVRITRPGSETPATATPGVPAQQPATTQNPALVPGAVQDPALIPGAVPNPGFNPVFTPGTPGFANAPGFGIPPFNAGAQVVTPYPTILNLQPQSAVPGTAPNGTINSPNTPAPVQLVCNPGPYVAYSQAQNAVLATQLVAAQQQVQAAEAEQESGGGGITGGIGSILLGAFTPTIDVDLGGTEIGIPLPVPALISSLLSGGGSRDEEDEAALLAQQQAAAQQQQIGQRILGGPQVGVPGGGALVPGVPGAPTVASTQVFTSYPAVINVAVPDELLEQTRNQAAGIPTPNNPDLGGIQLVCGGAAPLIPQAALTQQAVPQPGVVPGQPGFIPGQPGLVPGAPVVPGTTLPGNPSLLPQQGIPQQGPGVTSPVAPGTTPPAGSVAPGTAPATGTDTTQPADDSVEAEVGPVRLTIPRRDRDE